MMLGMVIIMEEAKLRTVAQIREFLAGTMEVSLKIRKEGRYGFIERTLKRLGYARHSQADKGVLATLSGAHDGPVAPAGGPAGAAVAREGEAVKQNGAPRHGFVRRYTALDAVLLAEVDMLHSTLSDPATKKLIERAFHVFGDKRLSTWRTFRSPTCTTCEGARPIRAGGGIGQRRGPAACLSVSAAPRNPMAVRATSA